MFSSVGGDESDIADVRVEIATVEVDGEDGIAAQSRIQIK